MELQGLREALKVEIQCHQVNERWCYFSLVGGSQREQGLRWPRPGAPRPGPASLAGHAASTRRSDGLDFCRYFGGLWRVWSEQPGSDRSGSAVLLLLL